MRLGKRCQLLTVIFIFIFSVCAYAGEVGKVTVVDGEYAIDVELEGGSGKAFVNSPTLLSIQKGVPSAEIVWSSPYYDYMIVDGTKYENLSDGEMNSKFMIPVSTFDEKMKVIADTTAMGTPHEIEYSLTFFSDSLAAKDNLPQEQARKVIWIALTIIVVGGILNVWVKKRL